MIVGGVLWARHDVNVTQPTPDLPDGGALWFAVGKPGVAMQIQALFEDNPTITDATLYIDFPEAQIGDDISFAVALSGTARLQRNYPSGVPREIENGCPIGSIWKQEAYNVRCVEQRLLEGSAPITSNQDDASEMSDVIFVDFTVEKINDIHVYLAYLMSSHFSVSMADTTYFQLPKVGSIYYPQQFRNQIEVDLGQIQPFYVPNPFAFVVQFRDLPFGSRLESVSDTPLSTHPLIWSGSNGSTTLSPNGIIIDNTASPGIARQIFWLAAVVGLLVGLVPIAAVAWRKAITDWNRCRRRSDAKSL